ncbi:DUF342 domain-containing protein [Pseudobacteriovorax antillogorgiicola]|uniref:Uncharacterized conserved protein, DUF342 family n=1 Tax=Pseudobacteriovorax antillogorgiicola TaxID=1513793 RepID=A0A1Y6BJH1_9BACT|nr:FapA family protein [Pseudobacteriovorax antillogorgiicola]TCS55313.1 uncharacterized protein (DUF342 family) [Pseudobacteriovorax antillogorgiicola]SMF14330.1 Uncharacterized conserved protein, DUF342 family [Pseudobacteriovorax antillogorgiicola]
MDIKLSYNQSNFRIRLTLQVKHAHDSKNDPHVFLKKTINKLGQLIDDGDIDLYYVFEHQFLHFWSVLKNQTPSDKIVNFDLGFGAKLLSIELGPSSAKALTTIRKIDPPDKDTPYEGFMVNIMSQLKQRELDESVADLSLRSAYYRWTHQCLKLPFPLFAKKTKTPQSIDVSATINRSLKEAYLYVAHSSFFQDTDGLKELYSKAKSIFKKIQKQLPQASFLGPDIMKEMKEEQFGLAALGAELPKVFLLAIEASQRRPASKSKVKARTVEKIHKAKVPKNSLFKIKFLNNDLEARIEAVHPKVKSQTFILSRKDLVAELKNHGIASGYDKHVDQVLSAFDLKHDLKNMVVATGRAPELGSKPYIYETYKDSGLVEQDAHMDIDMRDAQSRVVVDPGDVIAEIRYEDGKPGLDVFGNFIHATQDDPKLKVRPGDNVEKDEHGRFVSLIHGMPSFSHRLVDVSPILIHKGDVNLSSGNLEFDGSAEIKGNIESGATVNVTENLLVTGTIGQASVRCGRNLTVKGGIVSTERGLIQVRGKLVAGFVENSRIITMGDMIVSQSVMNSNIIVGGNLKIVAPKTGILGGGMVSVRNRLITGNLGFDDGKITVCRVGADWKIESKIAINEARLHRMESAEDKESKNFKEAKSKEQRRLARKGRSSDEIKKRLDRIGGIKRKIERRLKNLQTQLTWNRDSIIIVQNLLSSNVDLMVGGKGVMVSEEIKEVMVTYHKIRDGRINPLDFLKDFEDRIGRNLAS